MTTIHLIEGPVGAGKSTFAANLGEKLGAPKINLDDWISTLFSPDRPPSGLPQWYLERKDRCLKQIWKLTCEIAANDSDVILELGLITQADRRRFLSLVEDLGYGLKMYVLDAPREIRRERIQQRNEEKGATYSMDVPDAIFEMASDLWEPVDEAECFGFDVEFISTE